MKDNRQPHKSWSVEEKDGTFFAYDSIGNPYEFSTEDAAYDFLDDMDDLDDIECGYFEDYE